MDSHHAPPSEHPSHANHMSAGHYRRLALMALLSFLAMYALMYAMVNGPQPPTAWRAPAAAMPGAGRG